MSAIMIFFLVVGAAATVMFIAGYVHGIRGALLSNDGKPVDPDTSGDLNAKWWMYGGAVLAASTVIFLVGVSAFFVYLGPFLAMMTAAANGMAFFVDKSTSA